MSRLSDLETHVGRNTMLILICFFISIISLITGFIAFNEFSTKTTYEEKIVVYNLDSRNWNELIEEPVVDYICTDNIKVDNHQNSMFGDSDIFYMELKYGTEKGSCALLIKKVKQ